MRSLQILSLILIAIGAVINFIGPLIIKKKLSLNNKDNAIYITKSIGLVIVIIGCITFFWLGGNFGG